MKTKMIAYKVTRSGLVGLLAVGVFFCFFPVFSSSAQAVVFVDMDRPGGNGTSWTSAYKTLDAALAATTGNEEIWVAGGTYAPATTLQVKNGQKFYGGFAGTETLLSQRNLATHPTVLDGNLALRHLMYVGEDRDNVRIDGFTFTRGSAQPGTNWDQYGGGVCLYRAAQAVIANCKFTNNSATLSGGGLFASQSSVRVENSLFENNSGSIGGALGATESDIVISGSTFRSNTASTGDRTGGAICINLGTPRVENSVFENNSSADLGGAVQFNSPQGGVVTGSTFTGNSTARGGGAILLMGTVNNNPASSATVSYCTFTSNSSGLEGGGIYSYYMHAVVQNSVFYKNTAVNGGGVMFDYNNGQTSVIDQCVFTGNTATSLGGGACSYVRNIEIKNSLFNSNGALYGGAIGLNAGEGSYFNSGYTAVIRNCTVTNNSASSYGGGLMASHVSMTYIYNSIFWGNSALTAIAGGVKTPDIFNGGDSYVTTRYSDIQTLNWAHGSFSESHTGSFSQDPKFIDPDGADNVLGNLDDDLRLQLTSPCIDNGDGANATALDLVGTPRCDEATVANSGVGTPVYADIGAYERMVLIEIPPTISPASGSYSNEIQVILATTTAGATIRYTTDGSTPTASSAAGTSITLIRGAVLKARAFKSGMMESGVSTATYTMPDSDSDGLPDWVETNTGFYVSLTDTGTNPNLADTDGDGRLDGAEVAQGTDPNDATPQLLTDNDFDGDGISDYGCYYPSGGNWYLMMSKDGFVTKHFGYAGTVPVTGDFDGDGISDYGCYYAPGGNWYFMMSKTGFVTKQFGYAGTVPVTGDFDGDGITDYGCYYAPGGNWYFMTSKNGFFTKQFGYEGTVPVTGDFDGDGVTDYGCYYAPGGNWYFMMSKSGFVTKQFGYAGTVPVTGDFDGDGITDYGCYYAPGGNWYFMTSKTGFFTKQFGYAGTVPVTGDFDGDGITDYACYYAPGGNWYFMTSKSGFLTRQFGYTGTVPLGTSTASP